ncbi:JmjC domain, hydroxylase-domain-containing protein [Mucor mucedo]|uniref:JmjC domain, hydroxylase-domain-containing protein n=1 Tax=Mucor mucedo TaxID=29922 RepID=UPI00221F16BB|nr:JmjC domain, hydroxylase-domain-containing protein [Mucor mucedo]KAI7888964.1 JmjC domain, hydroxylase-domain-containing protein [Mucor mucedo]
MNDIRPNEYYDQDNGGSIPVFTPSFEEFKDFKSFMTSVEEYGKKAGVIKVIPPKEWKDHLPDPSNFDDIKVTKPITQHIFGGRGVFNQTNIENRKDYSLEAWRELCNRNEHRPPKVNENEAVRSNNSIASNETTSHLTTDQYKEIERHYWRNITFNQPMYGADLLGSLFDDSVTSWNPNSLDNTLNKLGMVLPGVNSPYLYFGMWKATFPWHVEDMDLYSINYIHFGAPKQWYVIQPCYQKRFENFMQATFFTQYKDCHEFLRHKTFIVSPKVLQNNNIPVQKCVQQPGEFIITFPFGYHSGYNLDFNCAESVNFALDSWIEIGKNAKSCTCIDDSVRIDIDSLLGDTSRKKRKTDIHVAQPCILCSIIDDDQSRLNSNCRKYKNIHTICAESINETYIKDNLVYGIDKVPTSRWKLTCIYCKEKNKGACMQCCFGKCWKSFHATCAIRNDGTMIRKAGPKKGTFIYDGFCPQHDPQNITKKQNEKNSYIKEMTSKLTINRTIYTKWRGGGYYQGQIVECLSSKQVCRILLQDGITRSIPWRDIYTEDPSLTQT